MADTPDISVVFAVQDEERALPVLLAHLEQQSLPAARYELIIVDNGSRDKSFSLVERFARGAPVRTRVLRQKIPNQAAARNMGLAEARAPYVLFIDSDLLAGPELLEQHLVAQRDFGDACIVGAVREHPQMTPHALTRWFLPEERRTFPPDYLLPYLDWRFHNTSLPRQRILDAGGFDEGYSLGFFEDRDLAWRLIADGLRGHYVDHAPAYIWRPSQLAQERRRYFFKGYSLFRLAEKTRAADVFSRYRVKRGALRRFYQSVLIPYQSRPHDEQGGDIRVLGRFYRLALQHELARGYEAAHRGKIAR